jgi:hypothetical protein
MTQTLYLDGRREPLRVDLYGAALRIGRRTAAPAFAPLGRTRRICCWGRVQWAGEALLACAARAVPISFLSQGRGVACFLPNRPPPRAFAALVEDAALNPAWSERLENWVDSEIARSLAAVVDRQSREWAAIRHHLASGDARQALRAGVRLSGGAGAARRVWRQLQEYLHAWASARLHAEDLLPLACFGYSSDKPNLPEHFTRALAPLLLPALAQQCARESRRRRPDGPLDHAGEGSLAHRCALAFDSAEPRLSALTTPLLRRFERLVRDCAEEVEIWPGF